MASKYCDRVNYCKHNRWCADDYNPERDNHECFVQLTNADRIRAMSDEDLAEWLTHIEVMILIRQPMLERPALKADWRDWLKSPVEETE